MAEIANVNIFIQDVQSDRADLKTILILSQFAKDDATVLKTGIYFTDDGLVTGTASRIRYYSTIEEVSIDFLATSDVYKYALTAFAQKPKPSLIAVGRKDATDTNYAAALDAIALVDNNFYGLVCTSHADAEITNIAAWTETQAKLFSAVSSSATILQSGTSDIASTLKASAYNNTMLTYHAKVDAQSDIEPVDIAILARFLSSEPGKSTAKFKTLQGITSATYSTTELVNLKAKNCNIYTIRRKTGMFEEGQMCSGRFLDTQNFGHYFEDKLEGDVFDLLYRESNANRKIDFSDDSGLSQLESVIINAIKSEIDKGTLVKFPKLVNGEEIMVEYDTGLVTANDTTTANRAKRVYDGLSFKCQYSNAIHDVDPITGIIYV